MLFFITQPLFKLTSDSNKKTKKSLIVIFSASYLPAPRLVHIDWTFLRIRTANLLDQPLHTLANQYMAEILEAMLSCKWFRLSKLTLFVNTINLSSFNSISAKILELKVLFCEVKHDVLHVSSIYLLLMKRNILVQIKFFTYLTFIQQFPKISSQINSFTIFNKIALFTTWEWNAYMKPIKNQDLLRNLTTCNE